MQEKEYIMDGLCELKIPSLGITVRHYSVSFVMPNSYPEVAFSTSQPLKILIVSIDKVMWKRSSGRLNEPAHEIMALVVLRKLNLQTRMHSHPVGLYI